jgi:cell volume regulation protein A
MADPLTQNLVLSVTYFGILLGLGILIANLLKKRKIPDTLFLLLLGLCLGPTIYNNPAIQQFISVSLVNVNIMGNIPDFLRILALIMVVFTSMFNIGMRAFKSVGNTALNLAVAGVVFNTVVMGLIANLIFGFDIVLAFVLAAILSGTGTAVIYSFEDTLKGARRALNVVKVESILNSPLSVLVPFMLLELLSLQGGAFQPMEFLSAFWVQIGMGVGAGAILGLGAGRILKGMLREYSAIMLFAIALITYALSENVGGSGMLAVAVAGLISGMVIKRRKEEVRLFEDHLSEMLRISVFTLLGAQISLFLPLPIFMTIILFFLIMFFIRPVFLYPVLGKERKKFDRQDFLLMSFVTPRGLGAAAIIPIVAKAVAEMGYAIMAELMLNIVFMVILLSVLFSTLFGIISEKILEREHPDKRERKLKEEEENTPPSEPEPYLEVSPGEASPEGESPTQSKTVFI